LAPQLEAAKAVEAPIGQAQHAGLQSRQQWRRQFTLTRVRISANVTDDFGNVTGLSGRC
jgi:hypothetical protein